MAGDGYTLFHPGLTKYHHVGLVVPFLAAISPMFLASIFKNFNGHHVYKALLFGIIVAGISYFLMKTVFREDKYTLNKAVLLGLLVSELTIFSASEKIPSIVLILFFLFMYFVGMAEVE
jgi:hypothetical protein